MSGKSLARYIMNGHVMKELVIYLRYWAISWGLKPLLITVVAMNVGVNFCKQDSFLVYSILALEARNINITRNQFCSIRYRGLMRYTCRK